MSKSPYYQVFIKATGEDITKFVSDFTHEDCLEEDDLVKFNLTDINADFVDNPDLTKGAELTFQYGYLSFKITNAQTAVIKKIEPSFAGTITMNITCLDKGSNMKKNAGTKIWKGQTATQIIRTIVKRYGLTLTADPTTKIYTSLPQGNRTDFEFIRYLTTIEKGGSYMFYIKDYTAFFIKRDLAKDPVITFTYGDSSGKVISFKPVEADEGDKNAKDEASVVSVNPATGEVINKKVTPDTQDDKNGYLGDSAGKISVKPPGTDDSNTTGDNISFPATTDEEAGDVANNANKKAGLKELTATLLIEGDTLVKAGDIISIGGVPKKYSGNWRVKKAIHKVSSSGYLTELQLDKNIGTDVNKKTGPTDGVETKTIYQYNKDGIRISQAGASASF